MNTKTRSRIAVCALSMLGVAVGFWYLHRPAGEDSHSQRPPQSRESPEHVRPTDKRARVLYQEAFKYADRGKMDLAIRIFDRLVSEEPDSDMVAMALYQRAIGLESLNRVDEAKHAYRSVQDRFPDSYLSLRAKRRLYDLEMKKKHLSAALSPRELDPLSVGVPASQPDASRADCGPEALHAACEFMGVPSTIDELAQTAGTSAKGTSMLGLARAARKKGLTARGLKVNYAYLDEMPMPAIVWVNGDHFMLITSVQGHVLTAFDPGVGQRKISRQSFTRTWSGYVLALGKP